MILTVDHGVILTIIEMVKEIINQPMFRFVFLVFELKEVEVCETFVSQFQVDQHHFPGILVPHS